MWKVFHVKWRVDIICLFPMWRNWIRRGIYRCEYPNFRIYKTGGFTKEAQERHRRRYKELGKILMKLQGDDF